jgi:EAL domain-containing protein (putative c-di-GMP-specific phosphodiesterase class I)/cellulose synthase/poly-beta-1,6-N-acetylglucosamine synthase-like glycosyltransferase/chitodextrinase
LHNRVHPGPARSGRAAGPAPEVPPPVSDRRVALGRAAILATVAAWAAYTVTWVFSALFGKGMGSATSRAESVVYLLVVTLLTASTVAYLLSRLGFFYRAKAHRRASRAVLEDFWDAAAPPEVTVLVPAFREEARVVRDTVLSAALQEYPLELVLLLDDPPVPSGAAEARLLAEARALPAELTSLLDPQGRRWQGALQRFEDSYDDDSAALPRAAVVQLADDYTSAAGWLASLAGSRRAGDHAEAFFVEQVLGRLERDLREVAGALGRAALSRASLPASKGRQLYRRLAWIFTAQVSVFERKRYCSLSREPNKAMNLNSYIGLMGGRWKEEWTPTGLALVPAMDTEQADLSVPNPAYVLTLDADSVLLPEYCLRLVHLMEQAEHQHTAIAQTPYSSFPGATSRIERVAGATTDLQHLVHQGLTYFGATFWVGANALIRKAVLDSIKRVSYEGDWDVPSFISDRTVIEDTESTIDLATAGWQLFNYPERLSYSATPPDFGSLCIQRRRWATGGLLILPRLRAQRQARRERGERTRFGETFLRSNYMASITWSSLGLLVLLAFPFSSSLVSPLLGLVALPYFLAMASDLRYCGYRRRDVLQLYGFNLLLLPVNLAGTVATVVQAITASKVPFARTPKVKDRTVVPPLFVVTPWAVLGFAIATTAYSWERHHLVNVGYGALNALLLAYALVAFVGVRNSIADASVHAWKFFHVPAVLPSPKGAPTPALSSAGEADWRSVLGLGPSRPLVAGLAARTVFQPVVNLRTGKVEGFEALARFADGVPVPLKLVSTGAEDAATVERGLVENALRSATDVPEGCWVAVKASGDLLASGGAWLREAAGRLGRPVVVEVPMPTGGSLGAWPAGSPLFDDAVGSLGPHLQLALDNCALTQATAATVAALRPAWAKLDVAAVSGIAGDASRQAALSGLLSVAALHGCTVVAGGVETEEDRAALAALGVTHAQGFLLGAPMEMAGARPEWRAPAPSSPVAPAARRMRISLTRVTAALASAAIMAWGVAYEAVPRVLAASTPRTGQWFAPYVDVTVTPTYQFQDVSAEPARQVVLGFVVADPSSPCQPSWGGSYTLAQAGQQLNMASRIAQLEDEGVGVGVSFGGQANTELAAACTDAAKVATAYESVLTHYHVHVMDLDVEGASLTGSESGRRRAAAVSLVERWAKRKHWGLSVWLTLPTTSDGMDATGEAQVSDFLRARVGLAGVNLMTMDMGAAPLGMTVQVEGALNEAHAQLAGLFRSWGLHMSGDQVWQHMGATVMIGQNNDAGEVFTTGDATRLESFASRVDLKRISMWSLNRDSQCGTAFSINTLSNVCSGTPEQAFQFSTIFGSIGAAWGAAQPGGSQSQQVTPPRPDLNPANAPYPLWNPTTPYQMGYKVVREGYIYQAKWYSTGVDPSAQVQFPWETPWELIGPVLPSDRAPKLATLAPGTYPAWAATATYTPGDEVLYDGLPYTAKWQNEGSSPGAAATNPYASPWQPDYKIPGEPPA